MKVNGVHHRSLWVRPDQGVEVIDQRVLPFTFATRVLRSESDVVDAIRTMAVRGAPLIGVAGAYGVALAMRADSGDDNLAQACRRLDASRPTATTLVTSISRAANHSFSLSRPSITMAGLCW